MDERVRRRDRGGNADPLARWEALNLAPQTGSLAQLPKRAGRVGSSVNRVPFHPIPCSVSIRVLFSSSSLQAFVFMRVCVRVCLSMLPSNPRAVDVIFDHRPSLPVRRPARPFFQRWAVRERWWCVLVACEGRGYVSYDRWSRGVFSYSAPAP